MNGLIKIEAKSRLLGKTAVYFIGSFTVLVLGAAMTAAAAFGVYALTEREFFEKYIAAVGGLPANLTVIAAFAVIRFSVLVFLSALHLGETAYYINICETGTPRFPQLFSYCKPKKAFRAFRLYAELFALKSAWFLFFNIPALLCGTSAFFTVYRSAAFGIQSYILTLAAASLAVMGIMFFYCISRRYRLCSYIAVKNEDLNAREIIRRSVESTDGSLAESALFGFSMAGWRLLSILPFSFIYALPYCKIAYTSFNIAVHESASTTRAYTKAQAAESHRHFPRQAAAPAKE